MNLNFVFKTNKYLTNNSLFGSGPINNDQVIEVKSNNDGDGFAVTFHNIHYNIPDSDQIISLQLAANNMLIEEETPESIVLAGAMHDFFGCCVYDCRLTIILKNGIQERIILQVENRIIEYLKAE